MRIWGRRRGRCSRGCYGGYRSSRGSYRGGCGCNWSSCCCGSRGRCAHWGSCRSSGGCCRSRCRWTSCRRRCGRRWYAARTQPSGCVHDHPAPVSAATGFTEVRRDTHCGGAAPHRPVSDQYITSLTYRRHLRRSRGKRRLENVVALEPCHARHQQVPVSRVINGAVEWTSPREKRVGEGTVVFGQPSAPYPEGAVVKAIGALDDHAAIVDV